MTIEIKAPSYPESVQEGTLVTWHKKTGDSVETDGEYVKILGRQSELIKVGGEKVYPQEVENLILQHSDVEDVTIFKEHNAILGNIVCADVVPSNLIKDKKELAKEIKKFCYGKIERYKIPIKINFLHEKSHSKRFKKVRRVQN